jgi:hypothetical protein
MPSLTEVLNEFKFDPQLRSLYNLLSRFPEDEAGLNTALKEELKKKTEASNTVGTIKKLRAHAESWICSLMNNCIVFILHELVLLTQELLMKRLEKIADRLDKSRSILGSKIKDSMSFFNEPCFDHGKAWPGLAKSIVQAKLQFEAEDGKDLEKGSPQTKAEPLDQLLRKELKLFNEDMRTALETFWKGPVWMRMMMQVELVLAMVRHYLKIQAM